MSCVSHPVGLTSVKATAQWDELQRGLEAVLRVLVSSEYLSWLFSVDNFDLHRKHVCSQNSAKVPTLAPCSSNAES